MSLNTQLSDAAASDATDAITALLDGGSLKIYAGAQPADADTAITSQTLLAQLTFGTPAFAAAVDGVATANAITDDSDANATGTASFFRACKNDGTVVFDGTVGTGTHNLVLGTTSIAEHGTVSVTSLTFQVKKTEA